MIGAPVTGVVLGAWYMLWLVQRLFFGRLREPAASTPGAGGEHDGAPDLAWYEILALTPLAALVVWIGVQPQFFLRPMAPTLDKVTAVVEEPLQRAGAGGGIAEESLSVFGRSCPTAGPVRVSRSLSSRPRPFVRRGASVLTDSGTRGPW